MRRTVLSRKRDVDVSKEVVRAVLNNPKNIPFRRWKSAVRTVLREVHRKEINAEILLKAIDASKQEQTIIQASILARGSVHKRYNKCGKKKCHCYRGSKRHGPYWYLSLPMPVALVRKGSPKMKNFYIDQEEALMLKARIANFKTIQDRVWNELYDELVNGGKLDTRVLDFIQTMV